MLGVRVLPVLFMLKVFTSLTYVSSVLDDTDTEEDGLANKGNTKQASDSDVEVTVTGALEMQPMRMSSDRKSNLGETIEVKATGEAIGRSVGKAKDRTGNEFKAEEEIKVKPKAKAKRQPNQDELDPKDEDGEMELSTDGDETEDDNILNEHDLVVADELLDTNEDSDEALRELNEPTSASSESDFMKAVHILDMYFHIMDLHDGSVDKTISVDDFDFFVTQSLNTYENIIPNIVCHHANLPAYTRKFSLNSRGSRRLFVSELEKHQKKAGGRMSRKEFIEMALREGKLNASFRRAMFVLIYPHWSYTQSEPSGYYTVTMDQWLKFLQRNGVTNVKDVAVCKRLFEDITGKDDDELSPGEMDAAIHKVVPE